MGSPTGPIGDPAVSVPALAAAHRAMPAPEAEQLARDRYGLETTAARLATEKDDTFRLTGADGRRWILKAAHPAEPTGEIDFQTALLAHVARADPAVPVPRVLSDQQGQRWAVVTDGAGQRRVVRLMTYCPGAPLDRVPSTRAQRRATGELLARLRQATAGFAHPADSPVVAWDVQHLPRLRPLLASIPDPGRRAQLARGAVAIDVATALLNQLSRADVLTGDIFADGRDVLDGYQSRADLTPGELQLIPPLVMARVVARALTSTHRAAQFPANAAYLLRNTEPGWAQLGWFLEHSVPEVTEWLV